MRLSDFEEYIEPVILQRGYDYFKEGRVSWIEASDHGIKAGVEGNDDYIVSLYLKDNDYITYAKCSCPYDLGQYCKHQVAVFYALRKRNITGEPLKVSAERAEPGNPKESLGALLDKLNPTEMRAIILSIGEQYPEIAHILLAQYASPGNEIAVCQQLMREYIHKAKRQGFIECRQTAYAIQGINITLEKAEDRLDNKDFETAVGLVLAALPLAVGMLQYCDDSDGNVDEVIEESLAILDYAVSLGTKHLTATAQKSLMASVMQEALNQRYDDWTDWRYDLLGSCTYFAAIPELRQKLESQLTSLRESMAEEERYDRNRIKSIELEIIELFDDPQRVEEFIDENISSSDFREKALQIAMKKQDYDKVAQLALEGEQIDSSYAGLVHKWKKYRYLAYEKLGDVDNQRQLGLHLIYEREFDYYAKLKALYPPEDWPEVVNEILKVFENMPYQPDIYVNILIQEKLSDRLLNYCQQHPETIVSLYKHLREDHRDEVSLLFRKHIKNEARAANQRSKYRAVCSLIRDYKKACGANDADRIIAELQQTYPRRPAFIEELSKI